MQHRRSFVRLKICYSFLFCLVLIGSGKAQSLYVVDGNRATGLAGSFTTIDGILTYGADFGFTFFNNRAEMSAGISKTNNGSSRSGGTNSLLSLTLWPLRIGNDNVTFFGGVSGGFGVTSSEALGAVGLSLAVRVKMGHNFYVIPAVTFDHVESLDKRGRSADVIGGSIAPLFVVSKNITLGPTLFVGSSDVMGE